MKLNKKDCIVEIDENTVRIIHDPTGLKVCFDSYSKKANLKKAWKKLNRLISAMKLNHRDF